MRMNGEDVENKEDIDDDDEEEILADDGELSSRLAVCRVNNGVPLSPRARMEQEKRLRREIANSNERRRMQSINAGFQTLKALLPRRDGEKMSKASILQQTSDFITLLQQEKHQLAQKIAQYKVLVEASGLKPPILQDNGSCGQLTRNLNDNNVQMVNSGDAVVVTNVNDSTAPPKKRRRYENHCSDSSDEGLGMMSDLEPKFSSSVSKVYTTVMVQTEEAPNTPAAPEIAPDKAWEMEMMQRQVIEMRLALDRERRTRLLLENQLRNAEINRLQSLTRLSSVSLLEYPTNFHTAVSPLFSTIGSSNFAGNSSLLVPPPLDSLSNNNNMISSSPSPQVSTTSSTLMSPPMALQPSTIPKYPYISASALTQLPYSNLSTATTVSSSSTKAAPCFHSNSSRQSLEAIVEAIRHLEGDQLFIDVECKPNTHSQNTFQRYQQNDSGISSPVSERPFHPLANGVSEGASVELQTLLQQTTNIVTSSSL